MRKLLLACCLVLPLSGCAALQSFFGNITAATPTQLVQDVQNAAITTCEFIPTAETVANIIALNNPVLATASGIANAICAAVTQKGPVPVSLRRTVNRNAPVPTVSGVPIHGQFVH